LIGALDRLQGQDSGVDRGGGLQETGGRGGEVELHVRGVDDLAVVVVVDRFGDDQRAVGIAQAVQVEVGGDDLRVQRGAVGEGDVVPEGEGVLGGVFVDGPVGGQPRFELESLGVLVDEPVGEVVD